MKIKQFIAYALLLLIAAGAQPAYSAYWQWSRTAATNATADPTINWSEGMSPSSINDSARAQMARSAEQRDDQSGLLTTGGTSTAYTVTSNQGMCLSPSVTPQVGQSIAVTMHTTNGASPTLGVDSCTVFPIQSAGVGLSAGTLVASNPYTFTFNGSAWVTVNAYNNSTYNIPLGGLLYSTVATPPNANFLAAAGQCISQSTYAAYYAALGSPGTGGCSAGNFPLLDTRGRSIAALDNLGGSAASRLTNVAGGCGATFQALGATCTGTQSSQLITSNLPAYTPSGSVSTSIINGNTLVFGNSSAGGAGGSITGDHNVNVTASSSFTGNAQGGTSALFSNVPPNVAAYIYVRVL